MPKNTTAISGTIETKADTLCPECGRPKARSAGDILAGACPKYYASSSEALLSQNDCERHAALEQLHKWGLAKRKPSPA